MTIAACQIDFPAVARRRELK